jgi:hypothetical protein
VNTDRLESTTSKLKSAKASSKELLDFEQTLPSPDDLPADTDSDVRLSQREFFKILRKQNVHYNESEKRYYLRYYANNNPDSERFVPLSSIKTDHSSDDDRLKYPFAIFCYGILLASLVSLFGDNLIRLFESIFSIGNACVIGHGFFAASCNQILVTLIVALLFIFRFAYLSRDLINNFVSADANWRNSIDQFFNNDIHTKMDGIRLCLLTFRQFIKWRRFANFFYRLFVASIIILYPIAFFVAYRFFSLQLSEILLSLAFLFSLWVPVHWFMRQKYVYTEWRDPSVQLCVMIAEMHQIHVDNKVITGGQNQT